MSNEITFSVNFSVNNGGYSDTFNQNAQFNQNAIGADASIVTVSTSGTAFTFQNVTTFGWIVLQNLDSTNYVEYGPVSGGSMIPFGQINAGEYQVFRLFPGITFKAQADTASVQLYYQLFQN